MKKNYSNIFFEKFLILSVFLCLSSAFLHLQMKSTISNAISLFCHIAMIGVYAFFAIIKHKNFIFFEGNNQFEKNNHKIIFKMIAYLIAINTILKLIGLPMGMTLSFVLPILLLEKVDFDLACVVSMGSLIFSALFFTGIGPWLVYQMAYFIMVLYMFKVGLKLSDNKYFKYVLLTVLAYAYGILMTAWFYPSMHQSEIQSTFFNQIKNFESIQAFFIFYMSSSFIWDTLRAIGNVIFYILLNKPFDKVFKMYQNRLSILK